MSDNPLAALPRTDAVLDALTELPWRRSLLHRVVQESLDQIRTDVRRVLDGGERAPVVPDLAGVLANVRVRLDAMLRTSPRPVLNATGVLLHTNVGRAPLPSSARAALQAAAGTCDLEIDLDTGRRGSRYARVTPLLAALCDAEDAHVVNNGAAALLLACTALAGEGAVAMSRGQLVEIGDGFRVATMASAGGAARVEVGSTNRTHLNDFEAALDAGASVVLWIHQSNFSQSGFVEHVQLRQLSELARSRGVPLVADLGSGALDDALPGDEPTVSDYLGAGADLVTFSGDKLLGGPQAGLMAGAAPWVQRCRRFPMARALRPGKTTLAALHATLVEHARTDPRLPLLRMCDATIGQLRGRAEAIADALGWGGDAVHEVEGTIGGGSLPGASIQSVALVVPCDRPEPVAARLRRPGGERVPVIARIHSERLWLDLRSVSPDDDDALIATLRAATGK